VEKTVSMKTAKRRSHSRKAGESAPAKPQPTKVPFFLDHGRAWINGSEVGGSDPRYAHLNHSYD
jgi:hypothetical protein